MIQYIIAAGIGAFLGSQSKKSKKSYAHGGKVELHKHPQGHWMLINPLSFQVGEDFLNEQDAKDYAWNNGIELTNSSYAHGGEVDDLEYSEIYDVLKDKIDDAVEDISSTYDQANDSNGEEVESKSRDGFIPYTNGGYSSKWFEYINMLSGSGASLPTSVLDKEMQRQVDYSYELAKDRFVEENEELVKEIGEDKVNYHDLYELGYGDEAESLSEMESDMGDDSILMQVEAMYYAPHNDRGIDGKNTIRLSGSVNLEAPYHRRGNLDDYIESEFTFNSVEELETKMDSNLKKVIGWFEGDNYSESKRELKIRRMAKGGKTDEYVAITLKPKKSAYRGGKGEIYKNMQLFYDTINSTDNKDKYEFIHSLFISDSRKSDPKDISEIKVYMIGEKSGFDDVEKRGLYDLFDLVKTKEEVKDYAKGGETVEGKNGYIAFYKGKQMEVYADSSLQAREKAAKSFKARKSYDVNVVLAEKDGEQVTHYGSYAKGGKPKPPYDNRGNTLEDMVRSAENAHRKAIKAEQAGVISTTQLHKKQATVEYWRKKRNNWYASRPIK